MDNGTIKQVSRQRIILRRKITSMEEKKDEVDMSSLQDTMERLFNLDDEIHKTMTEDNDISEEVWEEELLICEEYRDKCFKIMSQKQKKLNSIHDDDEEEVDKNEITNRNYKLPTIQWIKFDGEISNWIKFWGQFSKVDGDETLGDEDKYQYL